MRGDSGPPLTVDLWSMATPDFPVERWLAVLDDDEQARARRFLRAGDCRDYVAAHVLARHLLAARGAGRPAAIAFRADGNGKPHLVPAAGDCDLRFNLTHTDGLVAVATAEGADIGVDAEATDRPHVDDDMARAVFTAAELELLKGRDDASRRQAFFRLWTLKEAVAKALGTGLSTPLTALQVLGDPPRLEFLDSRPGMTEPWHLGIEAPTARHLLALAVACGDRPVTVRRRVVDGETLATTAVAERA